MPPQDAASLAKLFRQEARGKLLENAKGAAQEAGASTELADFFDSLSSEEINTLIKTWDAMDRLGVKGRADGATVTFL